MINFENILFFIVSIFLTLLNIKEYSIQFANIAFSLFAQMVLHHHMIFKYPHYISSLAILNI